VTNPVPPPLPPVQDPAAGSTGSRRHRRRFWKRISRKNLLIVAIAIVGAMLVILTVLLAMGTNPAPD